MATQLVTGRAGSRTQVFPAVAVLWVQLLFPKSVTIKHPGSCDSRLVFSVLFCASGISYVFQASLFSSSHVPGTARVCHYAYLVGDIFV